MRVNVKNYMYKWFDNMLILQTEDDNVLCIYCPSECIYNDEISRYYCYKENLQAREFLEIDYVDYHTELDSDISCDGIAHFIQYRNDKKIIVRGYRCCKHRKIPDDILNKAGGYWQHRNDNETVENDRKKRQWSGFISAISDAIRSEV